jgi:hypothetical protein
MASLSQLLQANNPAQAALIAAALRRGQVKTSDLLTPGMYDPNLDFSQQSQNLGYLNTVGDTQLSGSRIHEGLLGGSGFYADPVTGQRTDYTTQGSLADLLQNRNRAESDYHTNTQQLGQSYQRLGAQQAGAARAAGVAQGGALVQAMQKRTANQGQQQGQLDEGWRRYVQDYDQNRNSLIGQAAQQQQGVDISGQRAGAANELFQSQVGQAKVQSAQGLGTLPELPAPSFSQGYNVNQNFGNALAAAYYKRLGKKVPL